VPIALKKSARGEPLPSRYRTCGKETHTCERRVCGLNDTRAGSRRARQHRVALRALARGWLNNNTTGRAANTFVPAAYNVYRGA
jgi:hypothetical protein